MVYGKKVLFYAVLFCMLCACTGRGVFAQEAADQLVLPKEFRAMDTPNDGGKMITLSWSVSPSEPEKDSDKKLEYTIHISKNREGPFTKAAAVDSKANFQSDAPREFGFSKENKGFHYVNITDVKPGEKIEDGVEYYFKLSMASDGATAEFPDVVSAVSKPNWFSFNRMNNLILMIVLSILIMWFIGHARRNPDLFIRKIAGLDAVDEAIGRATEMGKPVFYLTGLAGMASVATIASTNILGRVARRVAKHDTQLKVPSVDPIVMSVCQEVVKEAYTSVGRPDAYRDDSVFYIAAEQFSFTAAVDGMMMREKPATNLMLGYFYAESLLLAEAGAQVGAIQIAGTDALPQLPFFVTTCDYTLIGEELYAASAYLSREPLLLGSLKGQDIIKMIIIAVIVIGSILAACGLMTISNILTPF